jgi:hypothetical protein
MIARYRSIAERKLPSPHLWAGAAVKPSNSPGKEASRHGSNYTQERFAAAAEAVSRRLLRRLTKGYNAIVSSIDEINHPAG